MGRDESILSGYLQAINEQDTAGGPDFLRQQGEVYDRVLRAFFSHQCNCKPIEWYFTIELVLNLLIYQS